MMTWWVSTESFGVGKTFVFQLVPMEVFNNAKGKIVGSKKIKIIKKKKKSKSAIRFIQTDYAQRFILAWIELKVLCFVTHKAQHGDRDWLGLFSAARGPGTTSETSGSGSASGPCWACDLETARKRGNQVNITQHNTTPKPSSSSFSSSSTSMCCHSAKRKVAKGRDISIVSVPLATRVHQSGPVYFPFHRSELKKSLKCTYHHTQAVHFRPSAQREPTCWAKVSALTLGL